MSSLLCKTSVYKAYQDVISDVISNVREHFIEDGVDETVLQELKQLWENKLAATKAVTEHKEPEKIVAVNNKASKHEHNNGNAFMKNPPPTAQQIQMQQQQLQQQQQLHQQLLNKQVVGQVAPNNHMPQGPMSQAFPEWRRVPIQLTIPSAPGSADGHRILSVDVPEVFLQGPHLKSILTGQVISTTMELPLMAACAFLQNHVDLAFHKHQESFFSMNAAAINPALLQSDSIVDNKIENRLHAAAPQRDGAADLLDSGSVYNNFLNKSDSLQNDTALMNRIQQEDGPADSSDEDDDKSDDTSDNDNEEDGKEDDEMEEDVATGAEEEPLNSGDDVSDADGTEESFETDNVMVCQYDKITRSRNRWKFHLKDGIMNLNGEDFIFQKANGDAEW